MLEIKESKIERIIVNTSNINFDDLIQKPSIWLFKSGIVIILITLLLVFMVASLISYPDKLGGDFIIITKNPPIELIPEVSTNIDSIFVKDKDTVQKGNMLIYLANDANYNDILVFIRKIESAQSYSKAYDYKYLFLNDTLHLGDLQTNYSNYLYLVKSLINILSDTLIKQKINNKKEGIEFNSKLKNSFAEELSISINDLAKQSNQIEGNSNALQKTETTELLFSLREEKIRNLKNSVIDYESKINSIKNEIIEIQLDRENQLDEYFLKIKQLEKILLDEFYKWEKRYVYKAKFNSQVSLPFETYKHGRVYQGTSMMSLLPIESNEKYVVEIALSTINIGRLEIGNKVLLHFDAFPESIIGPVETRVLSISLLPSENRDHKLNYKVFAELRPSLISNSNKTIFLKQKLTGYCDIITKKRSLLQRILDSSLNIHH